MVDRTYIRITTNTPPGTILGMVAAYFTIHYLQHGGYGPEWLRYYGKDLLLIPLLLSATEIAAQFLNKPVQIRLKEVVLAVVAVSLAFEWWIPAATGAGGGDPFDIVAYAAGGFLYAILVRLHRRRVAWQ